MYWSAASELCSVALLLGCHQSAGPRQRLWRGAPERIEELLADAYVIAGIHTDGEPPLTLPRTKEDKVCQACALRFGIFREVVRSLLLGVCGLLFFDYLQALDHLEGEAYYAALPALVLEVDRLVVVVDEHLTHEPAVVVEPLCPLGDTLVLYLARLLSHHPRLLLPCGSLRG